MESEKNQIIELSCPKHKDFKIEYIKVQNLKNNEEDQIFACADCFEQDYNLKTQDYQLVQKIVKGGNDLILPKWPSLNNQQLFKDLSLINKNKEDIKSYESLIEKSFNDFQNSIIEQIQSTKNKMIEQAKKQLNNKKPKIESKYQEFSKLNQLKNILSNHETSLQEKESNYKELINSFKDSQEQIEIQTNQLIQQLENGILKIDLLNENKQSILDNIKKINVFDFKKDDNLLINKMHALEDDKFNENSLAINKDRSNAIIFDNSSNAQLTVASDYILEQDQKHIFRIHLKTLEENKGCYVTFAGLFNDKYGSDNSDINCYFMDNNNKFIALNEYVQNKFTKVSGDGTFRLSDENIVEYRISLNEGIFEMSDYPHYKFTMKLKEENLPQLNNNSFKLLFFQHPSRFVMTLLHAFTVDSF